MGDAATSKGSYRIEVSGWSLTDIFFFETTELLWTEGGEEKLLLQHAIPEGAVLFVRLIVSDTSYNSVPVAYRVEHVQPKNSNGLCEVQLVQAHPRPKERSRIQFASLSAEHSSKVTEPMESSIQSELEEVLLEA